MGLIRTQLQDASYDEIHGSGLYIEHFWLILYGGFFQWIHQVDCLVSRALIWASLEHNTEDFWVSKGQDILVTVFKLSEHSFCKNLKGNYSSPEQE